MADKTRVFTENDVRRLLDQLQVPDDFGDVLDGFKSELTEVLARSEVDRLVALALVWGAWEYEGIPQAVWDGLFKDKLISEVGDPSGEAWTTLTPKGEAFLRAELERDR